MISQLPQLDLLKIEAAWILLVRKERREMRQVRRQPFQGVRTRDSLEGQRWERIKRKSCNAQVQYHVKSLGFCLVGFTPNKNLVLYDSCSVAKAGRRFWARGFWRNYCVPSVAGLHGVGISNPRCCCNFSKRSKCRLSFWNGRKANSSR